MVTRGINMSLSAKLQKAYAKRSNKEERIAATSSLKIEKLRSSNNDRILSWQTPASESTYSDIETKN